MTNKDEGPNETPCRYCKAPFKEGKCPECAAWTDSYGTQHRALCSGGFHDECPETKKPPGGKNAKA